MPETTFSLRQSCAELLACAMCDLFPGALLVQSTISEVDFFYDFILVQEVDDQILPLVEEKMRTLSKQAIPIRALEMMRENAAQFLTHHKQELKADLAEQELDNVVSIFQMGDFVDLCSGAFEANSSDITAFKLLSFNKIQRPDLEDQTIIRIHGAAFENPFHLKKFLKRFENYKKHDHRILGETMSLFQRIGTAYEGCWIWHAKGNVIKSLLLNYLDHQRKDYFPLLTPVLPSAQFIVDSHFHAAYKKDLLSDTLTPSLYAALTMKVGNYSLPARFKSLESTETHMPEELNGLLESTANTDDSASIFCSQNDALNELISCLQFIDKTIKIFGFETHWNLCVQAESRKSNKNLWKQGIDLLAKAFETCSIDYRLDTQRPMRYGARAEVHIADPLGRTWTGPFIDLDVVHPESLGLRYQTDDYKQTTVMITWSLFGSLERFIALLVEHYSGVFPFWLTPEQVRILPLAKSNSAYAEQIQSKLKAAGYRASIDNNLSPLGERVHVAEREKIPYIVIVGDEEEKKQVVALRSDNSKKKTSISFDQFLVLLQQEQDTFPAL